MKTLVHLVRHAEVHNPSNLWYGRLEGFKLSERGLRQAEALGHFFQTRDVKAVYCSPLQRAQETAKAISGPLGLEFMIDESLIESETKLQGKPGDMRLFRNPLNALHFINPFRPSWGESYSSIRQRMGDAVARMREAHEGHEAVAVSHMTPVLVARLQIENDPRPPWRAGLPCRRASVTTLVFDGAEHVATEYEPVGSPIS
ncbi:MAG: histidine phosphatase family protein [Actinomycetota bacterium]|nr:histidine phosphatase family protein [Actinomycetota bacterium]